MRKHFSKQLLEDYKNMNTEEWDAVIAGDISVSKWKDRDKKATCVLTTIHNPQGTTQVLRTQKDDTRQMITCPESIAQYNKCMGGVDRFDQLLSSYNISWKSGRWWMTFFYYCLEVFIANSFILCKTTVQQTSTEAKCDTLNFGLHLHLS